MLLTVSSALRTSKPSLPSANALTTTSPCVPSLGALLSRPYSLSLMCNTSLTNLHPPLGQNVPKYEKSRGAAQHRSPASHSSTSAASCFSTSSGGCHFDISELLYFADCKLSGFSHHYFLLFLLKVVVTGTHFLYHPYLS